MLSFHVKFVPTDRQTDGLTDGQMDGRSNISCICNFILVYTF